jgi:glycosyltransferase involved in cell wall biosynthesis
MKKSIAFVQNFCTHYTKGTFELLANRFEIDYLFFSRGGEWYWQEQHGIQGGAFRFKYLPGFNIGNIRINMTLPFELIKRRFDVYLSGIDGRLAMPITFVISKIRRKPFILWSGIWTRIQTPIQRLFFPITHFIYKQADAIVVYGQHVKDYLQTEGIDSQKIFIAGHATDNHFFSKIVINEDKKQLLEKLDIPDDCKVILYLGRLESIKGLVHLMEALKKVGEDYICVIAGTGSLDSKLRQIVKEKHLDEKVRFAGYVPISQTLLYYSIAWVLVLPSVTVPSGKETWGLVVNEVYNQCVPVIVTDAVGAAAGGMVVNEFNGLIVPEKRPELLAIAISRILNSTSERNRMGMNGKETVIKWSQAHMADGFSEAIQFVDDKNNDR